MAQSDRQGNPRYAERGGEARQGREAQYFAASPAGPDERRVIEVTLRGRATPMETSSGVFSQNRLDLGTSVLLRKAPEPPAEGVFLDLGCGWGPIAVALSQASPDATVWAVDVNERAVDLTAGNAKRNGCGNIRAVLPDGVPGGVGFDLIWSNPPIRVGKAELHSILMAWIPRLSPGGEAYLVVGKNLGADSLIPWLSAALEERAPGEFTVGKFASSKGYRLIRVARGR